LAFAGQFALLDGEGSGGDISFVDGAAFGGGELGVGEEGIRSFMGDLLVVSVGE